MGAIFTIDVYHRGSRGSRRRSGPKAVVQSFKKVILFVDASYGAGFNNQVIVTGIDSVAAGQTGKTDTNVPTGSIVRFFEVQFAANNATGVPAYINCTIQYILSGQNFVDPDLIGGHAQRNQVLHMDLFSVGQNQNSTHKFKFKIPPKFQRVREGMKWAMVWGNTASINNKTQIIYKFYR